MQNHFITMAATALLVLSTGAAQSAGIDSASNIALTEGGIGPINAQTAFDLARIKALFPRLKVARKISSSEGEEFPVIKVSDQRGEQLTINPGNNKQRIFSVVITGNAVSHAGGLKVGAAYSSVFGDRLATGCVAGMEEMSGSVVCGAPQSKHISLVFKGQHDGPDDQLPPIQKLKNWKVSAIVWKP